MEPTINNKLEINLGIIRCSCLAKYQFLGEVRSLLADRAVQPRTLLCVNAHIYNLAWKNIELRRILNSARIVAADGMSIVWASHLFSRKIRERCNMTEVFRSFLEDRSMQWNTGIIVGLTNKEADLAALNIARILNHCKRIKTISGFLDESEYKTIFAGLTEPDFVFIGMSTPRTENISQLACKYFPHSIIWGIGAGTIRIFAGTMTEAPALLRRVGLQWLFRLLNDPIHLWKRYLLGNFMFFYRIVSARIEYGSRMRSSF